MSETTKEDGGCAYPIIVEDGASCLDPGMSLRDWFAGQCMDHMISLSRDNDGGWNPDTVAVGCYALADAMLKAREDRS